MTKIPVKVCAGTSCHLMGNQEIIEALENMPDQDLSRIEMGYTSCFGACEKGPCVLVGDKIIYKATPEKVLQVIKEELKSEK
jgi:NADH:ubiquinone oxidoreductase subunit E